MLKLRLGNQIINLTKTKKGFERPGHKYIRRIPLPGGGYRYIYEEPKGRGRTEEILSGKKARAMHPETFDPLKYKFGISEEESQKIVNFKFGTNQKALKSIKDGYENSKTASSTLGFYKEAALLIGIEIGEGWLHNIDDAIYFLDDKYDSLKGKTDKSSAETRAMIERFMSHTKVLSELETPHLNGKKVIETVWNQSGITWTKTKSDLEYHSGREINSENFKFVPVSAETGQDVVADYLLVSKKDGSTIDVFSLKWNSGRPISLKEGSYDTATIGWLEKYGEETGLDSINNLAKELKMVHEKVKRDIKYMNLSTEDSNRLRSVRMKQHLIQSLGLDVAPGKRTQKQLDASADYIEMIIARLHSVHDDPRSKDTVLNVSSVEASGNVKLLQARASRLGKKMDQWLAGGVLGIKTKTGEPWKAPDGKTYNTYGNLNFVRIDTATGAETTFAIQELRNSKNASQLRSPEAFFTGLMQEIENDNVNVTKLLESYNAFKPTASKIKSLEGFTLVKTVQTTERKKMNAKYIRKELTESGKVRYIYKETVPRKKAVTEESFNRNSFVKGIDSVDEGYKSLFEDALMEIDDVHFANINAGCGSVRITGDVETFMDVLSVPPHLQNSPEFSSSAASFNVSKGKMAFCVDNFPEGTPEIMKKVIMMHEVGHAFFYGTLRLKHKKPLMADDVDPKDPYQKEVVKNAIKFVDVFGKMDDEIRKKAEFDVEGAKGQDKDALMQESIKTYMVSEYATLGPEEHFAEAFSRYFIMPEQLQAKEKEVYDHFEMFFQKHGR